MFLYIIDLAATVLSLIWPRLKMITNWATTPVDRQLVAKIKDISGDDDDYWAFRKQAQRDGVHGLIQYPAMMIPTMQAKLLEIVREQHGNVRHVLDPFVGGGTMLTEVMEQGLDFSGYDINPLAILACKVKAGPYSVDELDERVAALLARIDSDSGRSYAISFPGQNKWFTKGASIALSRISRAIQDEDDLWIRRFSWLSMAETIRRCSNSRTSTYKLHIRPDSEIDSTAAYVIIVFSEVINANTKRVLDQYRIFSDLGVLERGLYGGKVSVNFRDVTSLDVSKTPERFELLFTSPPYGDNATTIPYGQFSYLALNWIPWSDIDSCIPSSINKNTHSIDSASMGGSLRESQDKAATLSASSAAFSTFYHQVGEEKSSYAKRMASFCFDLRKSVKTLAGLMTPGGYMVWTLGNRSLAGKRVPLDRIVWDFLEEHGMRKVAQFLRPIPCKRMPIRNSCSDTMHSEIVIVAGA